MNCCDYQCEQGRDCPARGAKPADVARIGKRMPAPNPLPPQTDRLRHLARWMLIAYGVLIITMLIAAALHAGA